MVRERFAPVIRSRNMIAAVAIASFRADALCIRKLVLEGKHMAKIPGDKRPERTEPLLSDG